MAQAHPAQHTLDFDSSRISLPRRFRDEVMHPVGAKQSFPFMAELARDAAQQGLRVKGIP